MSTVARSGRSAAITTHAGTLPIQEASSPSPLADRARTVWPAASSTAATCSPEAGSVAQSDTGKPWLLVSSEVHSPQERAVGGRTFAAGARRTLPARGLRRGASSATLSVGVIAALPFGPRPDSAGIGKLP